MIEDEPTGEAYVTRAPSNDSAGADAAVAVGVALAVVGVGVVPFVLAVCG